MGKKSKRRNPKSSKINKKKPSSSSGNEDDKNLGIKWTVHDKKLAPTEQSRSGGYDDGLSDELAKASINEGEDKVAKQHPKGSEEALDDALEHTWRKVRDPYGVGICMGTYFEWMEWANNIVYDSPDQLINYWKEYEKDTKMHKNQLYKLSKETGSCIEYIQALNCIFHDTFRRVGVDHPPLLNLEQGMMMMNMERVRSQFGNGEGVKEPVHESHLKIWKGYEDRAFKFMKTVQDHLLDPRPEWMLTRQFTTLPLKNRGRYPTAEERLEFEYEDDSEEDDYLFGSCNGFSGADVEDLLAQGVKPWDDDAGAVLAALNGYDY